MHFFYDNVDIARKKLHQRIQQSPANKILFPKHTRAGQFYVIVWLLKGVLEKTDC